MAIDVSVQYAESTEEAISLLSGAAVNGAVILPKVSFPFEKELIKFTRKWRIFGVKFFMYKGKTEKFSKTIDRELLEGGFTENDAREAFVSDLYQKIFEYSKFTNSEYVRMDMRVGRFLYNPFIGMHRDAQTYLYPFAPSFFISFVGPGTIYKPYAHFNAELYAYYKKKIDTIHAFISRCEYEITFLKRWPWSRLILLPFMGHCLRDISRWVHSEDNKKASFTKLEFLPTQAQLFYHPGIITGLWHRAPPFVGPRLFVKVSGFPK